MDKIHLDLWEYIFRKWLDAPDLVRLSGVSKFFNIISHQITAYRKIPFFRKIPFYLNVMNIYQVNGWKNIAFLKKIYLSESGRCVACHSSFQTWKVFPNVYFSINFWKFSNEIPSGYDKRIIHIDSGDPKLLTKKYPYLGFSNIKIPNEIKISRKVKGMYFRYCNNINLEGYSYLDEIEFIHPVNIGDLTPLRGIKSVSIKHYFVHFDITPLRNSIKVDLTGCIGIEYFNILKNVKHLILDQTNISDISFLDDVEKLSLVGCKKLENIDHLKNMKNLSKLNINRCNQIKSMESLRGLNKLKWVSANNCRLINNVSMLGGVDYLDISRTTVSDVSMLSRLDTLIMRSTPVKDVSMLVNLKKINISCCDKIKDISMLNNVGEIITMKL